MMIGHLNTPVSAMEKSATQNIKEIFEIFILFLYFLLFFSILIISKDYHFVCIGISSQRFLPATISPHINTVV